MAKCEDCKYWIREEDDADDGLAPCHRRSPQVLLGQINRAECLHYPSTHDGEWPRTAPGEWCGEFEARE